MTAPIKGRTTDRPEIPALLDAMGELLRYPSPGMVAGACRAAALASSAAPEAAPGIHEFAGRIGTMGDTDLEELYTSTFDVNPPAALEVGWHLFGETYERGAFMVEMRDALRTHGIAERGELPDHLSATLNLLGRMPDGEARLRFAERAQSAVEKIRDALKTNDNPYAFALQSVELILKKLLPANGVNP